MSLRKTLFLGGLAAAGYHFFVKNSNEAKNEKQKVTTTED